MKKHITLDQLRAKHAWDAVKRAAKQKDNVQQEYQRDVKRLPIRIQTAGLGQALGFLYAKSKSGTDAKSLLLKDLAKWLLVERGLGNQKGPAPSSCAILTAIVEGDAGFLRRTTGEALLYLQWLGRFTEVELKQD